MENRSYALAAGLFVILLAAGLIAAFVWLGGDRIERVRYVVVSRTPVSGLTLQAPVRLRGVDVGNVEAIQFDRQDPRSILVTIAVDQAAPVTEGTYAQLGYWGLSGLTFLQLLDEGTDPDPLAPRAHIEMRPSFFGQAASSAEALIANANDAVEKVNELLSERNLAQIYRTLTTLERTIAALGQASQAIESEITQTTLGKFNVLADDLSRQTRKLDRLLTDLNEQPQSLLFGRAPPPPGPGEPGFDRGQGSP